MPKYEKLSVDMGLIRFFADGSASITISKDGRPGGEALLPAPGKSEVEIHGAVERTKKSYWLRGYYIDHTRRVKNLAFDRNRERTSTMISFRACRTQREAEFVLQKAKEIIEGGYDNEERSLAGTEEPAT